MTAPAIDVAHLTKRFRETTALDDVSFSVPEGSLFGFLGPNGAGKTTTLRVLTGLALPTSGRAAVLGTDVAQRSSVLLRRVGFLPDVPGFYPWMTATELLRLVGRVFGLSSSVIKDRTEQLLDLTGLTGVRTKIGGYSRGMKQRLGIAQALMNAPRVLMLDEPTSALDPLGRKELLDTIASLKGRATVFFSSHILADVERICDTVAILHRGKVLRQAAVQDLKRDHGAGRLNVHVRSRADELAAALEKRVWARSIDREGTQVRVTATELAAAQREIPQVLATLDLELVSFGVDEASLEDVFVELVGEPGP